MICNICKKGLECICGISKWIVFKVVIPGFPYFLAVFLTHFFGFDNLEEKIPIVIKSDVLILGASIAANVFESGLGRRTGRFREFQIVMAFVSLLFFLGIYLVLYYPSIRYAVGFKSDELEKQFWFIMRMGCLSNIVIGIIGDVFLANGN